MLWCLFIKESGGQGVCICLTVSDRVDIIGKLVKLKNFAIIQKNKKIENKKIDQIFAIIFQKIVNFQYFFTLTLLIILLIFRIKSFRAVRRGPGGGDIWYLGEMNETKKINYFFHSYFTWGSYNDPPGFFLSFFFFL